MNPTIDKPYKCDDNSQVVWCRKDKSEKFELHTSACYPNTNEANKEVCKSKQLTNTCTECSGEGDCVAQGTDADQKVSCKEDLTGITPSIETTDTECKYCYNGDVNNTPARIGDLGCEGCVPNEYKRKDSADSSLNINDEVCYNGRFEQFGNAEGGNFLHFPKSNSNELWDFALNATLVQSEGQSKTSPTDQFVDTPNAPSKDHSVVPADDQSRQTWRYYNCHNDDVRGQLNDLSQDQNIKTASDFLSKLADLKKCCDDENSYYITQTGYRYYSVEKCTNIALHDTSNRTSKPTNFSAYAYTTELNDSLIGVRDDLLVNDYACLEAKDTSNAGGEADVRHMMFIKQKTNGEQQSRNGELKHGIYKAFECPEKYECDENPNRLLCISNDNTQCNCNLKCKNIGNIYTISCGNKTIAACPKGTTLRIVGGNSNCDNQSNLKLDQIRCVPDGQLTPEQ